MILRQQSIISSTTSYIDPATLGQVKILDTNVLFFIHIKGNFLKNETSLEELS